MSKTVEISEDGFINMLMNQNGGALIDELDRELIKGVGAVLDFGGSGEINLKIKVSRIKGMDAAMEIAHDVKTKFPKEERVTSSMFLTQGNGLSAQFQKQESLGLGEEVQREKPSLQEAQPKNVSHIGDKK